jgi:hypothetical protein
MSYDPADQAQIITDRHLDHALRSFVPKIVPFSGFCLHCEEPVENARFCGASCRSDFEKNLHQRRMAGR